MSNFSNAYFLCLTTTIVILVGGTGLLAALAQDNGLAISTISLLAFFIAMLLAANGFVFLFVLLPFYWLLTKFIDFGLFCAITMGVFVVLLHSFALWLIFPEYSLKEWFLAAFPWAFSFGLIYGAGFALCYYRFNNGFKNNNYDDV